MKNFLSVDRKAFGISRARLVVGIVIGLFYSFIFYAFLYLSREVVRIWSVTEENDLWILKDDEVCFYNLVFAFIGLIVGQSVCFLFWMDRPKRFFSKLKVRRNSIANDQRILILNFVSWFGKVAVTTGMLFGIPYYGAYHAFSLYPDYNYIFILIIIVLFLQSWVNIRLTFKRGSFKWLLISATIISMLAFGMSRINFIDYQKINNAFLANNIYYKYDLELPITSFYAKPYSKYRLRRIYVVEDEKQKKYKQPLILVGNKKTPFEHFLKESKNIKIDRYQIRKKIEYQLYIDRGIKMLFVKKIKKQLSGIDVRNIGYAIEPIDRKYNKEYYRDYSLPHYIQSRDEESIQFWEEWSKEIQQDGVINYQLELKLDQLLFEGRSIPFDGLRAFFKLEISKEPEHLIIFHVDDHSKFGSYMKVLSSYKGALRDLQNELSEKEFGIRYDYLEIARKKEIYDKINPALLEVFPLIEPYFPLK